MSRDFNPDVGDGTNDLEQEGGHHHRRKEVGDVERFHQNVQTAVADDIDDIRYETAFAAAHLMACPTVDATIEVDRCQGKYPSKEYHDGSKGKAIAVVELVEVTEHQQQRDGHRREIKRCEERRNGLRRKDDVLVGHLLGDSLGRRFGIR